MMDDAGIEKVARAAAKATVEELFTAFGADVQNPLGMQADFAFIRTARGLMNLARRTAIIGLVGAALALFTWWPKK